MQIVRRAVNDISTDFGFDSSSRLIYCTDLHQIFRIGRRMGLWEGFIKRSFVLRSLSDVVMATNFMGKMSKIGLFTFIRPSCISNRIGISQSLWTR